MSYAKRKALRVRLELLSDVPGTLAGREEKTPWKVLKTRLDHDFSELVRMTAADDEGIVKCFTCEATGHWKEFDAGHFVTRDHLPTRWDMDNVKVQCPHQNRRLNGVPYLFGRALNELEPGLADRLILKGDQPGEAVKDSASDLLKEIREKLKIQRKRFR